MKTIGIKLADGSFYPIMDDDKPNQKSLKLTTAHNNQTRVMVDLYRSETASMDDAEYVDTLQINNINAHPRGDANISFVVELDENKELKARIEDEETGAEQGTTIELINRTLEQRMADEPGEYDISETSVSEEDLAGVDVSDAEESEGTDEAVAGAAAAGGLLAAAMLLNQQEQEEEPVSEEPVLEEPAIEEPVFEESAVEEPVVMDEPVDEPVMEETTDSLDDFATETVITDDLFTEDPVSSDFDLPDFDDSEQESFADEPVQEEESLFDLPDFEEETAAPAAEETAAPAAEETEMDWDFDEELTRAENSSSKESESNGLSFTGLYDKETELGSSSTYEEEEDTKKTKTSVIICIICAIICIIAVLLILFVIPSRLNILNKGQKVTEKEVVVVTPEEPAPVVQPTIEPEPEVPVVNSNSAKEDEIVIIEEAEEVKPEPPAPPVKEEPKPDIIYRIKWGDTLWDIADTYYKNPWRYKKIARYNGIKNPDYIISGTKIRIPQE